MPLCTAPCAAVGRTWGQGENVYHVAQTVGTRHLELQGFPTDLLFLAEKGAPLSSQPNPYHAVRSDQESLHCRRVVASNVT